MNFFKIMSIIAAVNWICAEIVLVVTLGGVASYIALVVAITFLVLVVAIPSERA